jgi:hypothetical protein
MESTEQERIHFSEVAAVLGSTEEEINSPGILSLETIQEVRQLFVTLIVCWQDDLILGSIICIEFFRLKRKLKG